MLTNKAALSTALLCTKIKICTLKCSDKLGFFKAYVRYKILLKAHNNERQKHLVNSYLKQHLKSLFLRGVVECVHKLPGRILTKERQHHTSIQYHNIQLTYLIVTTIAYSYFHFQFSKSKCHTEKTWKEILHFSLDETYSKKS